VNKTRRRKAKARRRLSRSSELVRVRTPWDSWRWVPANTARTSGVIVVRLPWDPSEPVVSNRSTR
jgi:hypothetical protein